MKPTTPRNNYLSARSQAERRGARRPLPATDYCFDTALESIVSASIKLEHRREAVRSLRQIGDNFLQGEAVRDAVAEFSVLTLISAISAAAILSSIVAITRMVRGW